MTQFPIAPPPPANPQRPMARLPEGAVDAHVHMLGDDFPLWDGRVETPAPGKLDDWVDRLTDHLDWFGFSRVVVVHSIVYGADNAVTLAALRALGDRARGIGLLTDGAGANAITGLRQAGVMGVRLNYVHGGVLSWKGAQAMAPMLADAGMHVQMLMNAHLHIADLADDVARMPVPVVFDHLGWPDLGAGVDEPGFQTLLRLVGDGKAWVKLSAIYRLCDAPYDAADKAVAALVAANPERCLWGSDWPHIMLADAKMPDAGLLLNRFLDVVTDAGTRQRILAGNPTGLYGF